MSIVLSRAVQVALQESAAVNRPVLAWKNVVGFDTISATSEADHYPATNLANQSTIPLQSWKATSTATNYLTSTVASAEGVDYVGFAGHNFGSTGQTVSIERLGTAEDATWEEVFEPFIPGSDGALLLLFETGFAASIRAKLTGGDAAAQCAVMMAGAALRLPKGVQPGSTPLPYGRQRNIVTGQSQSGAYLGRRINGGTRRSQVAIHNIPGDWYRSHLDAFVEASADTAFFWAWAPETHPDEVGYAWLTSEPNPAPTQANGRINLQFDMQGVL